MDDRKLRAENLTEQELEDSTLYETMYQTVVSSFLNPEVNTRYEKMMLIGAPGSGKTFVVRKSLGNRPAITYAINRDLQYGLVSDIPNPETVVLEDTHYFLDICRWNGIQGTTPNTDDFGKTLIEIAKQHEGSRMLLVSDRTLADMAFEIKDAETRTEFLRIFGGLIDTEHDGFGREILYRHNMLPLPTNGVSVDFRGSTTTPWLPFLDELGRKITRTKDEEELPVGAFWRKFEYSVRKSLGLEKTPVIFPSEIVLGRHPKSWRSVSFYDKLKDYRYILVPLLEDAEELSGINSGLSTLLHKRKIKDKWRAGEPEQEVRLIENYGAHAMICPIRALEMIKDGISNIPKTSPKDVRVKPELSVKTNESIVNLSVEASNGTRLRGLEGKTFTETMPTDQLQHLPTSQRAFLYTDVQLFDLFHSLIDISGTQKKWPKELFDATKTDEEIRRAFVRDSLAAEGYEI